MNPFHQRDGAVGLRGGWLLVVVLLGVVLAGVLPQMGLVPDPPHWLLVYLLVWLAVAPILGALHEAGHALAAKAMGLDVFRIMVGYGRTLVSTTRFGPFISLGVFPFGGWVHAASPAGVKASLARRAAMIAAGPATHVAVGLVCWVLIMGSSPASRAALRGVSLTRFWQIVFGGNALLLLLSLIPARVSGPMFISQSDGAQLLALAFKRGQMRRRLEGEWVGLKVLALLRSGDVDDASGLLADGLRAHPSSAFLQALQTTMEIRCGNYREAREAALERLHAADEPRGSQRIVLLNDIAFLDVLIGDEELYDEADRFSAEAHRAAPNTGAIMGTRGSVLVCIGEVEEGRRLLRKAYRLLTDPADRSEEAAWMAIAEHALGRRSQAKKWLARAERLDTTAPSLRIARTRMHL